MTSSGFTRRDTFAIGGAVLASALGPMAQAEESPEQHGISAFGDLKYLPLWRARVAPRELVASPTMSL